MLVQALLLEQSEVQIQPGLHKRLTDYQTGDYKFSSMSGWNGRIRLQPFVYEHTL